MGHREKFSAIAEKHGLPPLSGTMMLTGYLAYACDLMCLAQGILEASDIDPPRLGESEPEISKF